MKTLERTDGVPESCGTTRLRLTARPRRSSVPQTRCIQLVFVVSGGPQKASRENIWSDNEAGSLEAPSSDPESQSWSKYISRVFQQAQIWLGYIVPL
ncbi:hypothetical protein EVAR_18782_1 [Eumeta japonica]|uniref:Uncharacterized protein n=1 Tax=Eumeta variegata TaxID=151549 RepID=A0A4C1ULJ0_EUMVA|nr:hypothetical protein EVAR_18782_1 [Eumeta japonica]